MLPRNWATTIPDAEKRGKPLVSKGELGGRKKSRPEKTKSTGGSKGGKTKERKEGFFAQKEKRDKERGPEYARNYRIFWGGGGVVGGPLGRKTEQGVRMG